MENGMKSGDYIPSQNQESDSNKKPAIIGIVIIFIAVIFIFFIIQNKKQDSTLGLPITEEEEKVVENEKAYLQQKKLNIIRSLSATSTRATSSVPSLGKTSKPTTASTQEIKTRNKIIKSLSNTSSQATISQEERNKIIESLRQVR